MRRVPRGRVVTYGQIAALLGRPGAARRVGWAMRICPADLPWHRVVNAQGGISVRGAGRESRGMSPGRGSAVRGEPLTDSMLTQRLRLQAEGVALRRGRVALARHRWRPANWI
ncbi:MAG: MGMT family protein [Candidatus Rokuibacteriota bacterium]